jgi:hypothetical protein
MRPGPPDGGQARKKPRGQALGDRNMVPVLEVSEQAMCLTKNIAPPAIPRNPYLRPYFNGHMGPARPKAEVGQGTGSFGKRLPCPGCFMIYKSQKHPKKGLDLTSYHCVLCRTHFVRVGPPGIEPGLRAPHARVLPVYYGPYICHSSVTLRFYRVLNIKRRHGP